MTNGGSPHQEKKPPIKPIESEPKEKPVSKPSDSKNR